MYCLVEVSADDCWCEVEVIDDKSANDDKLVTGNYRRLEVGEIGRTIRYHHQVCIGRLASTGALARERIAGGGGSGEDNGYTETTQTDACCSSFSSACDVVVMVIVLFASYISLPMFSLEVISCELVVVGSRSACVWPGRNTQKKRISRRGNGSGMRRSGSCWRGVRGSERVPLLSSLENGTL